MFSSPSPIRRLAAVGLGAVGVTLAFFGAVSGYSGPSYTATFDGNPAAPVPVGNGIPGIDVQVHSRDSSTWYQLQSMAAQHGEDCSAPPASHQNSAYEGAVFNCRNHMMTAINASGYGVIYLTPAQIFDFSNGGSITFEMSTERMSTRDWWDVAITPYEQNMALPLLSDLSEGADLQGFPLNYINIATDNGEGAPVLKIVRDGSAESYNAGWQVPPPYTGVAAGTNQSATRQTFKFTIANGRMTFERLASASAPALVFWDVAASANFTSGIVQFGHHSYNPAKDGAGVPQTRHWDNLTIEPATPFTLIKADRRYTNGGTVTFDSPAPANAYLRFAAVCGVRVDGQLVSRQPSAFRWSNYKAEHQSSYFVPIEEGKQSVNITFQADGWYSNPCIAKDFSIWSLGEGGAPSATSTPTEVPTEAPTNPPAPEVPTSEPTLPAAPTTPPTQVPTTPPTTGGGAGEPASPPVTTSPGSRIAWNNQDWYLHGANLPWYNWGCDFGCGANGGASSSTVNASLDDAFADAKASGLNVIRWWVFPGEPWQINRDSSGAPTSLNQAVYADLDAAVALAEKHDIYLDLVLFSGPSALPGSWLSNASHRASLATALAPMFARYNGNDHVMTWEIVNEPEFDIWSGKVTESNTVAMVKSLTDSVHANSGAYVTVGSAMLDGLGMWVGVGLDYYQAHWYDYMQPGNWCARCTDYATVKAQYNLDAPLVIGEFFAATSVDARQRYEDFYTKGYAGAWSWSLLTNRTSDGLTIDLSAAKAFANAHGDEGPTGSAAPPPATPTATPTNPPAPTATPTNPPASTATPTPVPPTPAPATATPAATKTATPTNTPAPTKTPTVAPTATPSTITYTTYVKPSSTSLRPRSSVRLSTGVKISVAMKVLVDVEVYSPSGKKVYQAVYDNQSFGANSGRTYFPRWVVPANAEKGVYTVKLGIFKPGWGGLLHWAESAATFTVR